MNNDGYWTRASDYGLYRDPTGKFHVIPHDMNETFQSAMMFGPGPGPGFGPGRGSRPVREPEPALAREPEPALVARPARRTSIRSSGSITSGNRSAAVSWRFPP